ncbi:hypothetical protein DCAR_0625098 [Daucus carota subsp. sativus]|uniref:Uncharacterized protein n=1 Tax=Daucus carota subsp. sativus TaxID=79200 RepID=A0AAF1B5S1_DAUCS|nr:hypothetical protein DCAR_0625098 [Daucus carota subsp. sativus]
MSRTILRTLQGPKEQNPRGLIKHTHGKSLSDSDKASVGRVTSGIKEPVKQVCDDEKSKMREAARAETVMQLICWGPH